MRFVSALHLLAIGMGAAAVMFSAPATAKLKVLHVFGGCTDTCDGVNPVVGLTGDGAGNLYGITNGGGANSSGVIFKLAPTKKGYKYSVLYSINCNQAGRCPDGDQSQGELVVDTSGNLYGTMVSGGANNAGTLFRLSASGKFEVLVNFCSADGCSDGGQPTALTYIGENIGALYDGTSPLYGVANTGAQWGGGMDYTFTPGGGLHQLDSFCHYTDHDHCSTGRGPNGALAVDNAGALYGANAKGSGESPYGTIWDSAGGITVLRDFCKKDPPTCKQGNGPVGVSLDPDSSGLYGTTRSGGTGSYGLAFRMDTSGSGYTILHNFCNGGPPCKDGAGPNSALYPDHAGGMIGVTSGAGAYGEGTIYRIDLATGKLSTQYAFCKQAYCPDGATPYGRVVAYGGSLFGTTYQGGSSAFNAGVVYQYTP